MSIHVDCGKHVVWARRRDDPERFQPPLELVGIFTIINEEGIGIEVPCFQQHFCDPVDVETWQARIKALELTRESISPSVAYEAERQDREEREWEVALKIPCPKCGVPAGEKCLNLSTSGRNRFTRYPHPVRLIEAEDN